MAKIEWLEIPGRKAETWNPIRGCSPVSRKCEYCWARAMARRGMQPGDAEIRGWDGTIRTFPDRLAIPFSWETPQAVAVGLMSDVGHGNLDDEFRAAIHGVSVLNPDHLFVFTTARPANLGRFRREWSPMTCANYADLFLSNGDSGIDVPDDVPIPDRWEDVPNVWDLVSVEDQNAADERIPELLAMPSALRGLSIEPMLGQIEFDGHRLGWLAPFKDTDPMLRRTPRTEWIVIGGESGPGARPFVIEHAQDLMRTCRTEGVPVFMKQLGSRPYVENLDAMNWPEGTIARSQGTTSRRVMLRHPKGADMTEWPPGLRVREWPKVKR